MKKRVSTIFSLVVLAVILVGFPLISLNYLNKGLDYRRTQIEKLDSLGIAQVVIAQNGQGFSLDSSNLRGNIVIFSDEALGCSTDNVTLTEYIQKFVNYDHFRFVTLTSSTCQRELQEMYQAPKDRNPALSEHLDGLLSRVGKAHALVLVDRQSMARKVYDIRDVEDIEALVAHTSLLLPPQKNRD